MNRCKICDVMYYTNFLLDEGFCPVCEEEISQCLDGLEDYEEIEDGNI